MLEGGSAIWNLPMGRDKYKSQSRAPHIFQSAAGGETYKWGNLGRNCDIRTPPQRILLHHQHAL